jgi:putative intracellular protease/amidase
LAVATERRLNAGFLVVDGVYNTELTAPYDVLEHTQHHAPDGLGIEVFTVSPRGEPVTSAEGLRILPDHGFGDAPPIDILVVPSARESRGRDLENRELITWVGETGAEASIVMSLCWGAFVLAEADLLNGHACTTFPGDYDTFADRYPLLDLHINVSFVHDGRILTSQGGARSFDVATLSTCSTAKRSPEESAEASLFLGPLPAKLGSSTCHRRAEIRATPGSLLEPRMASFYLVMFALPAAIIVLAVVLAFAGRQAGR